MTTLRHSPGFLLLAGFGLWSVAFVALYGLQAVGCRIGLDAMEVAGPLSAQRVALVAAFAAFLAGHGLLWRVLSRVGHVERHGEAGHSTFARQAGAHLALAAMAASVFCFSGVLWLTAC